MFLPLIARTDSWSIRLVNVLAAGCVAAAVGAGLFMTALLLLGRTA